MTAKAISKPTVTSFRPGACVSHFDPQSGECKKCMIIPECKKKLIDRIKKEKEQEEEANSEIKESVICDKCKKAFPTKMALSRHQTNCITSEEREKNKAYVYLVEKLKEKFSSVEENLVENVGVMYKCYHAGKESCVIKMKTDGAMKIVVPVGSFEEPTMKSMDNAKPLINKILRSCGIPIRVRDKK